MSLSPLALDPKHRQELGASSISEEVILARGYWTATKKTQIKDLGFSAAQQLVPALVIPLCSPAGEPAGYHVKPDRPRVNRSGKVIKYEFAKGSKMTLDVPPASRLKLRDPKIPLIVTEGVKKADAAAARGTCCVALLGVWNWRGTNEDGGKVALPDWEMVALNDRITYIVFDSDAMLKPSVHGALSRLGNFLSSRGAHVKYVYLPHGPEGAKVGLDDFLAAGHTMQNVFDLATTTLKELPQPAFVNRFVVADGCIKQSHVTENGTVLTPLTNFTATVREELILDDNVTRERAYVIDGKHESGRVFHSVRVPAARFSAMNWTSEWGMSANIRCGLASKDAVREAIQTFSKDAVERTIYIHTGWRQIDDTWAFLMPNTAIGLDRPVEVEVASRYRTRYSMPSTPDQEQQAVRYSLATLDVVPDTVSFPLWSAMYRSVSSSILQHDLTLWVVGQTGSMKSTYTALQLSHFGDFRFDTLPEGWSSTVNALEKASYELRDLPLVIDDYAPGALDRRELESKAGRLLRNQGNSTGRSRLKSDLTAALTFSPRGLLVVTGEAVPIGQSANARSLRVEMRYEDVAIDRLDAAQAKAAMLPHAMSGFIRWLLPQIGSFGSKLEIDLQELRLEVRKAIPNAHARVAANVANLMLGAKLAIAYAEDVGAVTATQAATLTERARISLIAIGRKMTEGLAEERPSTRFLRLVATLVLKGEASISCVNGLDPDTPPQDRHIGWHDDEWIYLDPEAAYQAVARFAQSSGEPFPVSHASLHDALVKDGVAVPQPTHGADSSDAGRLTVRVKIKGLRRRVLKLNGCTVAKILGHDLLSFRFPEDDPVPAIPAPVEVTPYV